MDRHLIINGSADNIPLANESVQTVVTSPPYWGLRDYGVEGQLGLEKTPEEYVEKMVGIFREVWRILKPNGTLWLNLGDSYATNPAGNKTPTGINQTQGAGKAGNQPQYGKDAVKMDWKNSGLKPKDLVGIPWQVAFALQADGWWLRSDIIWSKPNPMPESVTDRPTKAHEYLFLLTKAEQYYYDKDAIAEKSVTFENRPDGIVRNREYGYDSKLNKLRGRNIQGNMSKRGVTRTTEGLNLKTQQEKTSETKNKRSVWEVTTKPYPGAHFAVFPPELITPCIQAGSAENDIVFDPFGGSGTTIKTAQRLGRIGVGLELNYDYCLLSQQRFIQRELF